MAERTSILYNFINNPIIYQAIQKLMSGNSFREKFLKENVKDKNLKILEVGCGSAEILKYIPVNEYYGYDIDPRSIQAAKQNHPYENCYFFNKKLEKKDISKLPNFDLILLFGILHHLNDTQAKKILDLCRKKMKKDAKLLILDPIFTSNQNIFARLLIKSDRGLNVRKEDEYLNLFKKNFKNVKSKITNQFFVPYTWFTTICKK